MLIIYDKKTEKILGHCSRVFDSGKWRESTLDEIYPNTDKSTLATAYMPDDARFIGYGPASWRLRKDDSGAILGVERLPALFLSCDAEDSDNDGTPDIPADGSSTALVTASTADGSDTEITFRTTRGTLKQRAVKTSSGKAPVEIRAATETVTATITATATGYRTATLNLEFIPVAPPVHKTAS